MTKNIRGFLLTAAGAVVLLAVLLLASGPQLRATMHTLVEVINTPDKPVPTFDVQNPACMPFQRVLTLSVPQGQSSGTTSFIVPGDKRLVIEHVSVSGATHPLGGLTMQMFTSANNTGGQHFLRMFNHGLNSQGYRIYVASEQVRFYADPGTEVKFSGGQNVVNFASIFTMSVSGYFADCTPGRPPRTDPPPGTP